MAYRHFTLTLRMELSILLRKGYSQRDIASVLKVDHSSVSRELKRNPLRNGLYHPDKAHHKAYVRRKYSKYEGMKISRSNWLENYVKKKLKLYWTPEQISGRLKKDFGTNIISFKSIYKWIYSAYGQAYSDYLPSHRYRPKKHREKKSKRQLIPNRTWIDDRPVLINNRQRLGDFEGDTLGKPKHSSATLVALVDRKSRYLLGRKTASLKDSMSKGFKRLLDGQSPQSLTFDNGVENVKYEILHIPTYFCHPYSSWEKGTVENTFQRLRRYIPKGTKLETISHQRITSIIDSMNNTPRKCLNYLTPTEVFKEHLIP